MQFKNLGKTFQLVVKNGEDLKDVLKLDEALWGATSAPVTFFKFDPALNDVMDPGKTGRIGSNAIKEVIRWFLDKVKTPAEVTAEFSGALPLAAIDEAKGAALVTSAKYILDELGAADKTSIILEQIRTFLTNVSQRPFNGDGILSPAAAAMFTPDFKALIDDVIATTGGTKDASGVMGASDKNIADFIADAKAYLEWLAAGALPEGQATSPILPMGADTAALAALVTAIEPQVSQFFKLSGLLGFDERIQPKSMATDAKLNAFDPANLPEVDAYLTALPLAKPTATSLLTLDANAVNPMYRRAWNDVTNKILKPVLGQDITAITPEQWGEVKALFAPFFVYQAGKKGASVERVAVDKLRGYVANDTFAGIAADATQRDKLVADIVAAAKEVEKLLLLRTYLLRLVNNFVAFPELYDPAQRAMFECGSLVIDGRWFNLAFPVENVAAHQALAKQSLICILYVEVTKAPGKTCNVVVPVTFGSLGNLAVGKRGVFFDLDGKEYDAKVVQLISNPVCVREALLAPFIKIWNIVEGKIESWSNNAEKTFTANFDKAISSPSDLAKKVEAAPAKKDDKQGLLLGASVAVAALGSAFAFISQTLSKMSGWGIIITILCALFALLAPISILAIIKLRKQDLSALLEGSGCAINLRMKLTSKLRGQFTNFGKYPKDAIGTPKNYFVLRIVLWALVIAVLVGGSCAYSCYKQCQEKKAQEAKAAQVKVEEAKIVTSECVPAPAPAAAPAAAPAPAAK